MSEIYQCQICSKVFRSKLSISKHERQLHPNNRIVPYGFLLGIASQEDFEKYRSAFIFKLKKTLSFDIKKTHRLKNLLFTCWTFMIITITLAG